MITFDTHPDRYKHWRLAVDGPVATLTLDVDEDGGLKPGYKLKLNSYDLGVDIELHDAVNRIRFEHPTVKVVVMTSGKERMFCAGANIYMLGQSSHAWKVNFCKFTNETRNGLEDSSRHSGLKFIAALNGVTAGGGYEVALACDEILLVDDRSSAVSLPEVPLLGVLPGTGGLTRLVDKRKVRRDLADVFCTTSEGVRAERAKQWGLIDGFAPPQKFQDLVRARAAALAERSARPAEAEGVALPDLERAFDGETWRWRHVTAAIDAAARIATITVTAPEGPQAETTADIHAAGADWWPLRMARELDDAILLLRINHLDIGTWLFRTAGDPRGVLACDAALLRHQDDWFAREVLGLMRRTFARIDVSSRSLFALIDRESCFAGCLAELVFAADRSFQLDLGADEDAAPRLTLSEMSFGALPMVNGRTRLATRFNDDAAALGAARRRVGMGLNATEAAELGLVTFTPDELDWDDEIRVALEERAALSPDALTGMEASLRFPGAETMETRIFGRLSAWQNWIFNRPNAVGEQGALKLFGAGTKPHFNWERV